MTRLKIFREPFTREGLRDLEADVNGFLRNIDTGFQSYSYTIFGDWVLLTIQYWLKEDA